MSSFGIAPRWVVVDNGNGECSIVALGLIAGGKNLNINLGDDHKTMSVKRDGTMIDENDLVDGLSTSGSGIIAQSHGLTTSMASDTWYVPMGGRFFVMVNVPAVATVDGVMFVQTTAGTYNAQSENRVGLYSRNGAILSLIAASVDNGDLWKKSGIWKEPFAAPVTLSPDVYWIATVHNGSGETVAPRIAAAPLVTGWMSVLDLADGTSTFGGASGTTLTATMDTAAIAGDPERPWLALYSGGTSVEEPPAGS